MALIHEAKNTLRALATTIGLATYLSQKFNDTLFTYWYTNYGIPMQMKFEPNEMIAGVEKTANNNINAILLGAGVC